MPRVGEYFYYQLAFKIVEDGYQQLMRGCHVSEKCSCKPARYSITVTALTTALLP